MSNGSFLLTAPPPQVVKKSTNPHPSLKQNSGPRSFYSDPSAIARCNRAVSLRINFRQSTRFGRRQPQTQQVALAIRLSKILERGSIVQNRMVVHQLNIARLKLHHQDQLRIVRQFVQQIESLDLARTE